MMALKRESDADQNTFFFTVRLRQPGDDLLTRHINLLRLSVRICQRRHPFAIDDAVILPDRIHTIWTLPPQDLDYAARWKLIKTTFARHLPATVLHGVGPHGVGVGRRGASTVWQRRYWERPITSLRDMAECRDLIRQAPVLAGLVPHASFWPYSRDSRRVQQSERPDGTAALRLVKG